MVYGGAGDDTMEKRIACMIEGMGSIERLIFIGYYYNQMSIDEIADETGLTTETVGKYLLESSNKIINEAGEGGIYYAALISFLAMGAEAVECHPP